MGGKEFIMQKGDSLETAKTAWKGSENRDRN
jgi:hypothetical protein